MREIDDKWDSRFMAVAEQISGWSKDKSTGIGAVIVGEGNEILSTGYNGFPRRVNDDVPERHERPKKYSYTAHAEENAIVNAARNGVAIKDCTMYVCSLPPCAPCARMIINAGIDTLVVQTVEIPERWKESIEPALEMLYEAGIIVWVLGKGQYLHSTGKVLGYE